MRFGLKHTLRTDLPPGRGVNRKHNPAERCDLRFGLQSARKNWNHTRLRLVWFQFFRALWAKSQITPLRRVMFALVVTIGHNFSLTQPTVLWRNCHVLLSYFYGPKGDNNVNEGPVIKCLNLLKCLGIELKVNAINMEQIWSLMNQRMKWFGSTTTF